MRQIKFRGKDEDGNWLEGDLRQRHTGAVVIFSQVYNRGWAVLSDTVGQFTGLQDREGRDIYEGDIVRWERDGRLHVVKFWKGMFYASVRECNDGIYGGFPLWSLCEEEQHCTIVGNIHDNPELIINKTLEN